MNTQEIKKDFTIFNTYPNLIYLDSAATSLTPRTVVDKITSYYTQYDANVARGVYKTSSEATALCERSRKSMAQFLSAQENEIAFTSGTTASINIIAYGLEHLISAEDNIITTKAEHHANFVPWQMLCKRKKSTFTTVDITTDGHINQEQLLQSIDEHTKLIALTHISNVLGTINPIKDIVQKIRAKKSDVIIVIDAAQSVAHLPIDVVNLDCDFLAFSLHKIFGATGIGVLYGKKMQLEKLEPLFTGGDMINQVTCTSTNFRDIPHRLEAGTPNIASILAVEEALRYIEKIGFDAIHTHEKKLIEYAVDSLTNTFGKDLQIYGPKDVSERSGIISFTFKDHHPHDIATILDSEKSIAIRAGQHCAMPLHLESFNANATARISLSIYNAKEDIDQLIDGLKIVDETLKK